MLKKVSLTYLYLFMVIVFMCPATNAQISNLKVNGATSNFIGPQTIGAEWEFDAPVGSSTKIEIWLHINGGTFIDPSTDKSVFGTFYQTDGDQSGRNGPPDFDGLTNGHVVMNMPSILLAPASYIFKFTNNNVTTQISGTIIPMPSPAYTISGKYTPHSGMTAQNILVSAVYSDNDMCQSYGLTDASGNYVVNLTSAFASGGIKVSIQDNISPYISSPADTTVTLTQSFTGINFTAVAPAAKIVGYLKGDDSKILSSVRVRCYAQQSNGDERVEYYTGTDGFFALGFTTAQVNSYPLWRLEVDDDLSPNYVSPQTPDISLHSGDSLRMDLTAYKTDDSIQGTVLLDGKTLLGQKIWVNAYVPDTANAGAYSDPTTGKFTLYVTKKFPSYYAEAGDVPDSYAFSWYNLPRFAPGAKNAYVNLVTVSWTKQTTPVSDSLFCVYFINPLQGWAGGANGKLITTTDGGTTWATQTTNTTAAILDVKFIDASTGWFTTRGGIIKKTTNGGANWISQNSGVANDIYVLQVLDANTCFATAETYLLKTANGGSTWTKQTAPNSNPTYCLSMLNATTGYCVDFSGSLYKTTDGGANWNFVTYTNGNSATRFLMNSLGVGYVAGNGSMIAATTDFGTTWSSGYTNSGQIYALAAYGNSTVWAAGQYNTIVKSTNGGSTWVNEPINANNNPTFYSIFFVDANNGWVVGDNGLVMHTINGGMVGVEDVQAPRKAYSFALAQNYPNPFNPSTVIRYSVPKTNSDLNHVTLKVYNMLGQLVTVLVDKEMPNGNFSATFNGHNLSSGIYLYTLQVGDQATTRKMLLLK